MSDTGGANASATAQPPTTLVRPLDLSTLTAFLNFIESPRAAEFLNRADGRSLYHYTDLGGFAGIVGKHDLWLTNARFSNDDREMTHGYDVARQVISDALKAAPPADKAYLRQLLKLLDPAIPEAVYICCFCDEDNLLSQWRAYGANGTGVSLKMQASEFSWFTGADMPLGVSRVWKVYYDEPKQRGFINDAIKFGRNQAGLGPAARARKAADAIKFFIPTFKHKDFEEEGEWRLIFSPDPQCAVQPDFRVARQILVPYFSLRKLLTAAGQNQLDRLPIQQVLVGPSPRGRLNKESAELMLRTAGYPPMEVEVSSTSFRGS